MERILGGTVYRLVYSLWVADGAEGGLWDNGDGIRRGLLTCRIGGGGGGGAVQLGELGDGSMFYGIFATVNRHKCSGIKQEYLLQ